MSKEKTLSVIVSKCIKGKDGVYRSYERLSENVFTDYVEARVFADYCRNPGWSVVLRPNYNECAGPMAHFLEWRSFDGSEFEKIRFDMFAQSIDWARLGFSQPAIL